MNVAVVHNCYGCGVCATICPRKIISIELNIDGFYEPRIKETEDCIDCGLCIDVCSYIHDDLALQAKNQYYYAAWSKDKWVREKCSSGGVAFEVSRRLIDEGYKVCGVKYNVKLHRAEHYVTSTVDGLFQSIGSKYIQSYTLDGFRSINRKDKNLVIGTPCQIDSFRRYVRKLKCEEHFVLMDFFCHGVPSMWLWKKYIKDIELRIGPISYVTWRNKAMGWHDSWNIVIGKECCPDINKESYQSRLSQGDIFFRIFLSDSCLGKACYEKCKFKYNSSSADIRIGDLWGEIYKDNERGVSAVIAFTEKGNKLLQNCNCELINHSLEEIAEGQMKKSPTKPKNYEILRKCLNNPCSNIEDANRIVICEQKRLRFIRIIKNPLKAVWHLLKRIFL